MNEKRVIGRLRAVRANFRFIKAQRKEQLQSRAAQTPEQVDEPYERLKVSIEDDSLLKDLDKLKSTADSGQRLTWFGRRFTFGFGVAKAIEDWFHAYDKADRNLPLLERIPRNETSNVAAKWLWFGFFTTLIGVLFSLLVACITAWFLYKQTNVFSEQTTVLGEQTAVFLQQAESTREQTALLSEQATILSEQVRNTRETDINAQRTQYAQILYDEQCETSTESQATDSADDKPEAIEICTPIHNKRIRTEAAIAFVKLERLVNDNPKLNGAQLGDTDLAGLDLSKVNFSRASLVGADLSDADLSDADLSNANLTDVILSGADISGVELFSVVSVFTLKEPFEFQVNGAT